MREKCLKQITSFFLIIMTVVQVAACSGHDKNKSLKSWITNWQGQLKFDTDSILRHYEAGETEMKLGANWNSFSIVNTIYADNSLGHLAKKAGDSTDCIVVEVRFYQDPTRKRQIMVAAEDSTCLTKILALQLATDSTDDFIFGKMTKSLY